MSWKKLLIAFLVLVTAGWMLFDGTRALIVGDFVTPESGEYAGQLGPWENLAQGLGIEPRSTLMKSVFVVYGLSALTVLVCYLVGYSWAGSAFMVVSFLGLWYLPFGTISNLIVLLLMMMKRRKYAATSTT
jgi:hypothetical protein